MHPVDVNGDGVLSIEEVTAYAEAQILGTVVFSIPTSKPASFISLELGNQALFSDHAGESSRSIRLGSQVIASPVLDWAS